MALNTDWKEFLNLLSSSGVRFLIVGAWARAQYVDARMTGALDIWIEATPETAPKVIQVLSEFGFGSPGVSERDLMDPEIVLQLGRPPRRIDLLNFLSGLEFEEAWAGRTEGFMDGVPVAFLSRADLVRNKLATGRPKDLADAADLMDTD